MAGAVAQRHWTALMLLSRHWPDAVDPRTLVGAGLFWKMLLLSIITISRSAVNEDVRKYSRPYGVNALNPLSRPRLIAAVQMACEWNTPNPPLGGFCKARGVEKPSTHTIGKSRVPVWRSIQVDPH
ncbi:hypothetical protein K458DRAFT_393853 [Lentithecium fluviatile CBS 122367]|uniref:Uncharacterized protein n=1 Tax=Lentithecium fluviatile CBS 122367 TaxID=1168545 RepID=A0A6G1INB5_9PLEO|nr:hypothetical protein K458DRAFT_393853 [Lentithecium fluviatile CBS 122367]